MSAMKSSTLRRGSIRRLLAALIAAALTSALLSSVSVGAVGEADANPGGAGNVATRWMQRTLDAVRSGSPAIHTSTPGAGRTYAMVTAAMYDAVNGIDVAREASIREPAIVASYAAAPPEGDPNAAASGAAHAAGFTVRGQLHGEELAGFRAGERAHGVGVRPGRGIGPTLGGVRWQRGRVPAF